MTSNGRLPGFVGKLQVRLRLICRRAEDRSRLQRRGEGRCSVDLIPRSGDTRAGQFAWSRPELPTSHRVMRGKQPTFSSQASGFTGR